GRRGEGSAPQPASVQDDQLAGPHFPDQLRPDGVKGAGFRGKDVGVSQPADGEGAQAVGILGHQQPVLGQDQQGESPRQLRQGAGDGILQPLPAGAGDQMGDHLGVGGGLENGARPLQFLPQASRVHQVAVGRQGQGPEGIVDNQGLGVEEAALPGGGVADVADGGVPRQFSQPVVIKHFRHQPHSAVVPESPPVGGGDAGAFLSPVLQRV